MEDRDGVGDRRRAVEPPDAGTARLDGCREPLPFDAASGHAAPPELARVKVREQVADASEVVGMRVRHGDHFGGIGYLLASRNGATTAAPVSNSPPGNPPASTTT